MTTGTTGPGRRPQPGWYLFLTARRVTRCDWLRPPCDPIVWDDDHLLQPPDLALDLAQPEQVVVLA